MNEKTKRSYLEAAHAMQSGVAAKMNIDPSETSPKHLRVGVNSAMVETAAIVQLLVNKGVIDFLEFNEEITNQMNREADRYEAELGEAIGSKVTLA